MGRRRSVPTELRALLDRARRNEGASEPRKHHVVPASYLARWTDGAQIRVTDLDAGLSYTTSPFKAARITDFYRMDSEDLDAQEVPPLLLETMLGDIEGAAKEIVDDLVQQPS